MALSFWGVHVPGPSFRRKFSPVQENRPELGFVPKNCLRAEIAIRADVANYLQSTFVANPYSFYSHQFSTFPGVNFRDRARIRVIGIDRADFVDSCCIACVHHWQNTWIMSKNTRIPGLGVKTMFGQKYYLNGFWLEFQPARVPGMLDDLALVPR